MAGEGAWHNVVYSGFHSGTLIFPEFWDLRGALALPNKVRIPTPALDVRHSPALPSICVFPSLWARPSFHAHAHFAAPI